MIVLEPTVTPKQNVAHEPKGARLPIPNSKKAASDIDELLDSYRNLTNEENEILGELQKLRLKRQSLLKKGKQMQEDQLWKLSEQLDKERTGRTQLEQRLTRLEAQLHLLTAANSPKSDVVGTTAGLPITTTSSAIVSNSSATTSLSTADNNRSSSSFKVVASGSSK